MVSLDTYVIIYLLAVFPMLVLIIFFIYGLTLEGAKDGILYYIKPDFEKLKDFNVWSTAASQVGDGVQIKAQK